MSNMKMRQDEINQADTALEGKSAQDVLSWGLKQFFPKIALASSFGVEDVVLIDLLVALNPKITVFTLDTGRLNEETYDVMERIRRKYGIAIKSYFPNFERVQALERAKGFYSFRESVEHRQECCGIRKVEPLGRALAELDAWITGLRRTQAVTRADVPKVEADTAHGGIVKLNPLADWSESQVRDYITQHQVPYNALHDAGYPSIGCAPCTRAIKPGEDVRAGRWWWERPEHKECGLHSKPQSTEDLPS